METHGRSKPTAREEAAEALAAAEDSRRRASRADYYPAWFWLVTGLAVAGIVVILMVPIPEWVMSVITLFTVGGCLLTSWVVARVRRMRGPRNSVWRGLWPVVPTMVLLAIAIVLHTIGWWADPAGGLVAAGVICLAWTVTGTLTNRRLGAIR